MNKTALMIWTVALSQGTMPSPAAGPVQQQGSAAVWMQPAPDAGGKLAVRLSTIVTIKLTVEGDARPEVEPLRHLTDSPAWKTLTVGLTTSIPLSETRWRWEQTFRLMPLDKGDQALPLPPLKYRIGQGDWQTATWQPLAVTVTTIVSQVDGGAASDITDIEHLPAEGSWWPAAAWAGGVVLVLALMAAFWFVARRRRQRRVSLSPEQAALRELGHLLALRLPEQGRAGRFLLQVSNILRRYFERRLQLPVQRQTTTEFLAALRQEPRLAPASQELLRKFLERCDLAKFAGVAPTTEECQELAATARKLLEESKLHDLGKVTATLLPK
jgi:hypothetical protein